MNYELIKNAIVFERPPKKRKNGLKILFYREPDVEKEAIDYPVAYADISGSKREFKLPDNAIQLFEVLIEQPRFKWFPFIWYSWIVCNPVNKEK